MTSIDDEWENYLFDGSIKDTSSDFIKSTEEIPICEDLYISTKTKVLYLNSPIEINEVFWNIPILEYGKPQEGIIKKQMKIVSKTIEEYEILKEKLNNQNYYTENIIKQINNPEARRIKFKDERKITIGISKKDIMNCRGKVKNAFYNCFAIILRFLYNDNYKEIHVKVFNTGKLEIPGIINDDILHLVKQKIINLFSEIISPSIAFEEKNMNTNVLVNSNFNCGFYVDRDKLHNILKNKYNIDNAYDPCSYPGVKCKFYFNNELGFDDENQKGLISKEDYALTVNEINLMSKYTEVSFMIFRTGSCLIIGNCCEKKLHFIYNFIKNILISEYKEINIPGEKKEIKIKNKKIKYKSILKK